MTLEGLNQLSQAEFTQTLGAIFEHSPWVAEQAWPARPFASVEALHTVMVEQVQQASHQAQLSLICAHPDLGSRAKMADASVKEQAGAGLNQLTPDEFLQITRLNREYTGRFGFPFIFAVKGRSKLDVLASMQARLGNNPEAEFMTALEQIYRIALFRLQDAIKE
jgi:OHCU decarboxylase